MRAFKSIRTLFVTHPVAGCLCLGAILITTGGLLRAQRASVYGGSGPGWWVANQNSVLPRQDDYDDSTGRVRMVLPRGIVQSKDHPFFTALGSNNRACITCHQPSNGMSVSAEALRDRWEESEGKDGIFAAVDGSNCPDLPQGSARSHSLLLTRGLFRIGIPAPRRNSEFRIEVVSDPTGCNTSPRYGLDSARPTVSVFRRPRMTANLRYVVPGPDGLTLMADGRETTLRSQAISAATSHEEANTPDERSLRQIVDFEMNLFEAQGSDSYAGLLNELKGPLALGPENLADGKAPRMNGALPKASSPLWLSFDLWRKNGAIEGDDLQLDFRASVARGSDVFFGHHFETPSGAGTCASCHTPQAPRWMDIGTANVTAEQHSPDLPLFRVTCDTPSTSRKYFGRVILTEDPGRALISGKCADVGALVMQQFHGLPARAPYFTSGSAATLADVVEFYQRRFNAGLTAQQKLDLVNFLRVL